MSGRSVYKETIAQLDGVMASSSAVGAPLHTVICHVCLTVINMFMLPVIIQAILVR